MEKQLFKVTTTNIISVIEHNGNNSVHEYAPLKTTKII